jgi:hypothetical protein
MSRKKAQMAKWKHELIFCNDCLPVTHDKTAGLTCFPAPCGLKIGSLGGEEMSDDFSQNCRRAISVKFKSGGEHRVRASRPDVSAE